MKLKGAWEVLVTLNLKAIHFLSDMATLWRQRCRGERLPWQKFCRVWDLGFWISDLGFRVQSFGFRILGLSIYDFGFIGFRKAYGVWDVGHFLLGRLQSLAKGCSWEQGLNPKP